MATELFKETMQDLKNDYVEFAKSLNEEKGVNPESLKLSLLDYTSLYIDYFAIHMQDQDLHPQDDEDYPEEQDEDKETY